MDQLESNATKAHREIHDQHRMINDLSRQDWNSNYDKLTQRIDQMSKEWENASLLPVQEMKCQDKHLRQTD